MPFTITTYDPDDYAGYNFDDPADMAIVLQGTGPRFPRTVATLSDAQWSVAEEIANANSVAEGTGFTTTFTPHERSVADDAITEAGGRVTLAGGCVVDVRPVTTNELREQVGMRPLDAPNDADTMHAVDTFNDREV